MPRTPQALADYFNRIGFAGPVKCDLATLDAVHRAQAMAVPYEDIDVFAGSPVSRDIAAIHDKIVRRHRGGWCYETNELLAWALEAIGFDVERCAAGVWASDRGDDAIGNHMVPLVQLGGQTYLCDLGLGDALRGPIPLREGPHRDGALIFRLERLTETRWRFTNHPDRDPRDFDLLTGPGDAALFDRHHHALQADPSSFFRQNLEAIRMEPQGAVAVYGRVLRRTGPTAVTKTLIPHATGLEDVLAREFGLTGIPMAPLWPAILARHAEVFGTEDALP